MPEAPGSWYSFVMMPSTLVHSRAQEDVGSFHIISTTFWHDPLGFS